MKTLVPGTALTKPNGSGSGSFRLSHCSHCRREFPVFKRRGSESVKILIYRIAKSCLPVVVAVMKVRHMSVTMYDRLVPVPMSVRFSRWIGRQVLMLMVFIVTMRMFVFQGFM